MIGDIDMCETFSIFSLAASIIFITAVLIVIIMIRRFSMRAFGTPRLSEAIEQQETLEETTPKSLSGMDSVFLPKILADFPDFNPDIAKTNVKNKLLEVLKGKQEIKIHGVVINNYIKTSVERVIYYQAALQYRENGRLTQRRYCLHYAFLLDTDSGDTIAANCPNCGGAVNNTNQKVCEFCGSRLVNVLSNTWEFTEVYEG